MSRLTTLPGEMLHLIFVWLDPEDLSVLPRVCKAFNQHVKGNRDLCKNIYLNQLDKLHDSNNDAMDWEEALHDLVRLKLICKRPDASDKLTDSLLMLDKEPELEFVHKTVMDLLSRASSSHSKTHSASRNADILRTLFDGSASTRAAFLERSSLFERVRCCCPEPLTLPCVVTETETLTHQRSARLHCLYGPCVPKDGCRQRAYQFAGAAVYDVRAHTARTRWGPFCADGSDRVDWEKVEAVMVVLGYNMRHSIRRVAHMVTDVWQRPFSGSWPGSCMPPRDDPNRALSALELRDPYGVTGPWYRVVSFLDYRDFYNHNFSTEDPFPAHLPRPALTVGEATRLWYLKLVVTQIEPPGPEDGQELPVVHFTGHSMLLEDDEVDADGHSELIKGTVRLTREGDVHWTTSTSIYDEQERWKSEGIQVGGVGSARGILGFWFDRDYRTHGPLGPTALWRASGCESLP